MKCSREHMREAAVWMAMLRGPDRTARVERGFKRWLKADPGHTAAFEKLSTAWEETGALKAGPLPKLSRWQRAGFREGFARAASVLLAVGIITTIGIVLYARSMGISTAVGEQRTLLLDDGTRVVMNTGTRVVIDYNKNRRAVELKAGEAYFEVAPKTPSWPFIVTAGGKKITALGTAFVVRRDDQRVSVVLVDGKVGVSKAADAPLLLAPGERVTFDQQQTPRLDKPALDKVTAWRSGYIDLDRVLLRDAVAEMNRYSKVKISVERPENAGMPITGIFRAGDSMSFAKAMAQSYGLELQDSGGMILLQGVAR